MTIRSAQEFVRLRLSDDPAEYKSGRAHENAPDEVWDDVIAAHPDMKPWVVHNKTSSKRTASQRSGAFDNRLGSGSV